MPSRRGGRLRLARLFGHAPVERREVPIVAGQDEEHGRADDRAEHPTDGRAGGRILKSRIKISGFL